MTDVKKWFAQHVSDASVGWVRQPPSTRRAVMLSVLRRSRRWLVDHGDPSVKLTLYGRELIAPLSHELPYYEALYPTYNRNLISVVKSLPIQGRPPRIVDIGANIGDTAAMILSEVDAEILCIDADPRYLALLRANLVDDRVTKVGAAIGAATGARVRIERRRGTGAVRQDDSSPLRMSTLPDLLREHPRFEAPDLVKIDTDGHDFTIIAASSEWLANVRPALFYESDDSLAASGTSAVSTLELLASLGYRTATLWDKYGNLLTTIDLDGIGIAVASDLHEHAAATDGYLDIFASPDASSAAYLRG